MHAPDTVIIGGKVTTMASPAEGEALSVAGDRIVAIGTSAEILATAGPETKVIDVGGRRVVPGLIDSHVHFARAGFTWNEEIRWSTVSSLEAGLALIAERAEQVPDGQWITVIGGWHPAQFAENRHPTIEDLDRVAPDHPVLVQFLYDWGMLNTRAREIVPLRAAVDEGVDASTVDVDDEGEPVGIVRTLPSLRWLYAQLPKPTLSQQVASTAAAGREFVTYGLTGVVDGGGANTGPDVYRPIYETWRRGELVPRVRLTMHSTAPGHEEADVAGYLRFLHPRQGDDRLSVLGVGEIVMWPFHDGFTRVPDLSVENQDRLEAILRACAEAGWPVQMHIIRPETTDIVVDMWTKIHADTPIDSLRWSIVHGESVSERHFEALSQMGCGVVAEALLRFEGGHAIELWGEAAMAFSPPIGQLRDAGIHVTVGSDGLRGATHNPFATLQWLVTGKSLQGDAIWDPENVLDRHTALSLVTSEATWFSFEENERGRLAPGFLADLAVLTEDYFTVPDDRLLEIRSDLTMIGGEVVWDRIG